MLKIHLSSAFCFAPNCGFTVHGAHSSPYSHEKIIRINQYECQGCWVVYLPICVVNLGQRRAGKNLVVEKSKKT